MDDGLMPSRAVPSLPGGTYVRNTFLEFETDGCGEDGDEEDPWLMSMNPRRMKTDSVVERSSLRAQLEDNISSVLQGYLESRKSEAEGETEDLTSSADAERQVASSSATSAGPGEAPGAASAEAPPACAPIPEAAEAAAGERSSGQQEAEAAPGAGADCGGAPAFVGGAPCGGGFAGAADAIAAAPMAAPPPQPDAQHLAAAHSSCGAGAPAFVGGAPYGGSPPGAADAVAGGRCAPGAATVAPSPQPPAQHFAASGGAPAFVGGAPYGGAFPGAAASMSAAPFAPCAASSSQQRLVGSDVQDVDQQSAGWSQQEQQEGDDSGDDDCCEDEKAKRVDPALVAARAVAAAGGGLSGNTTVMVRHIPGKYTQQKLMREINSAGFLGKYDFFYLPMQPQSRGNRGFAFVNFCSEEAAEAFYRAFHGGRLRHFRSEQPVGVMPADLQGFERNAEHYAAIRKSGSRRPLQSGRALFFKPLPPHLQTAGVQQSWPMAGGDAASGTPPAHPNPGPAPLDRGLGAPPAAAPGYHTRPPGGHGCGGPIGGAACGFGDAGFVGGPCQGQGHSHRLSAGAPSFEPQRMAPPMGGGAPPPLGGGPPRMGAPMGIGPPQMGGGVPAQMGVGLGNPMGGGASQMGGGGPPPMGGMAARVPPSAGSYVQRFCAYCGKPKAPDHNFCAFCGMRSQQ